MERVSETEEIKEEIKEWNPEALLVGGMDGALIGAVFRCGQPTLALYDSNRIIQRLMNRDSMTYEEAEEYFEYNILSAWMGENTPCFTPIRFPLLQLDPGNKRGPEITKVSENPWHY